MVSTQRSVQVVVPEGARWMRTEAMPTVELAVAETVTVPLRYWPGSSTEMDAAVLSMTRPVMAVDVVLLPATSVATARNE